MKRATDGNNAWAFLHARNRQVDYSFALLPGFLIKDKSAQSRLGMKLRGEPGDSGEARLVVGDARYGVRFSVENARIDGELVRDVAGRLIMSTSGIIWEEPLADEDCSKLAKEVAAEIDSAWHRFWRDGRRSIIESRPRFVAAAAGDDGSPIARPVPKEPGPESRRPQATESRKPDRQPATERARPRMLFDAALVVASLVPVCLLVALWLNFVEVEARLRALETRIERGLSVQPRTPDRVPGGGSPAGQKKP